MNIYDDLNNLTRTLSNSQEFLRYKHAAEKVDANPTHANMVKDFMTAQMQISASKMMGQEPPQELIESFNTLYTTIMSVSAVSDFLSAQAQLAPILNDIQNAISKAVAVDASFLKMDLPFSNMGGDEDDE